MKTIIVSVRIYEIKSTLHIAEGVVNSKSWTKINKSKIKNKNEQTKVWKSQRSSVNLDLMPNSITQL